MRMSNIPFEAMASCLFCLILLSPTAFAEPIFLLLEGEARAVGEGETAVSTRAETSRASFVDNAFQRSDQMVVESSVNVVESVQTLSASNSGTATLQASAGNDAASATISLDGQEAPGAHHPLLAIAGEFQSLIFTDPELSPGTAIPVDISYVLSYSVSSAATPYQAGVQAHVGVYERNPIAGPDDIGLEGIYGFERVFGDSLGFESVITDDPVTSAGQIVDATATFNVQIGVEYLVHLWTSVSVLEGASGLSISGFVDPVFGVSESCTMCAGTVVTRSIATEVPEPAGFTLVALGFGLMMTVRRRWNPAG